ncbi:MAG: L,D-transpeptidase [Candidatus Dormibacteria bacterium]
MSRWKRRLRLTLVGTQLILTFGALQAAGALAATSYQDARVQEFAAAADRAHHRFESQLERSLADGTPAELLGPVVAAESRIRMQPIPQQGFVVDRRRIVALQLQGAELEAFSGRVAAVETQVEVALHQQLVDAVKALNADIAPAQAAGVDTASASQFATDIENANQSLATPVASRQLIDSVRSRDAALKDATVKQIAANEALASAQGAAQDALRYAQGELALARAIPVLNINEASNQVAALAAQLEGASGAAAFEQVAAGLNAEGAALAALLVQRQAAYDLLAQTRAHLARAQQGNIDVSASVPLVDAAQRLLDSAPDAVTIETARQAIQAVKNDVDVKYNLAVYGPGKVIVTSVSLEELEALQDGVVVQDTIVTTGRPSLPTPVGTFSITNKYSPYHMISPWPEGDRYYYPPVWMKYAMLWRDGGYFIHDAPWRTHYGPGSDTEYGGTHGCINVPAGSMGWLYGWAEVGTRVTTIDGVF